MLKLGSQTGSLSNHLMSRAVVGEPVPLLGMGCTFLSWSDREAGTIAAIVLKKGKHEVLLVESGGGDAAAMVADGYVVKRIGCQQDDAKRVDSNGMSECQEYVFSRNEKMMVEWFAKDKKGFWVRVNLDAVSNRWKQSRGGGLRIGERDKYHDFSF